MTERLGIDYARLSQANPRLIYCSITAYGRDNPHSDRPGYDALVAARAGLQWEQRGWPEGAINHMAGVSDPFADIEIPYEWLQGAPRPGPLYPASYWPSLGAFFTASTAISAALRAREITGRGQWVETSLLQGAMACGSGVWQRAEKIDVPMFNSWILGSRSPKGHFECADGRWIHNWVPNPRFLLTASAGDTLNASPDLKAQNDPDRFGTGPEELLVMMHYQPLLAEAVKKFPAREWVEAAAVAGMTIQDVRTPEEALADPLFLKDGCVTEINDPDLGPIRQVGVVYRMSANGQRGRQAGGARRRAHRAGEERGGRGRQGATAGGQERPQAQGAARGHHGARPGACDRRALRHADPVRPRRDGHQGQRALRHLLALQPHRLHGQPRQAQHRAGPEGPAGDEGAAAAGREGRRRAAQHALRGRRAPEDRLREPEGASTRS